MKKKILFISEYYKPVVYGGAEISLEYLIDLLVKDNNQIILITPNYHAFKTQIENKKNLKIIRFKSLRYFLYKKKDKLSSKSLKNKKAFFELIKFFYMFFSSLEIKFFVKKYLKSNSDFDLIHANNLESIFALSNIKTNIKKAAHLRDLRVFYSSFEVIRNKVKKETISDLKNIYKTNYIFAFLLNFTTKLKLNYLKRFDKYYAISEFVKICAIKNSLNEDKILILNNFFDDSLISTLSKKEARDELNLSFNKDYALYLGTLSEEKGANYLPKIIQMNPSINFIIVGDGPYFNIFKSKNYKNLLLMGNLDSKLALKYFRAADVFIYPIHYSIGIGRVMIESFKSQIPGIYFDNEGLSELLINNENSILVKVGNIIEFNNKLKLLLKNKSLRDKIIKNAKQIADEKFDTKKIYQKFIKSI